MCRTWGMRLIQTHSFLCNLWVAYCIINMVVQGGIATCIIRGEPERAPNTWETESDFICMYTFMFMGWSFQREESKFEPCVGNGRQSHVLTHSYCIRYEWKPGRWPVGKGIKLKRWVLNHSGKAQVHIAWHTSLSMVVTGGLSPGHRYLDSWGGSSYTIKSTGDQHHWTTTSIYDTFTLMHVSFSDSNQA